VRRKGARGRENKEGDMISKGPLHNQGAVVFTRERIKKRREEKEDW